MYWQALKGNFFNFFFTFDDTVALLKYNLEFVNLLRGSISSASVYRSCAFCTFPKRNSVFPSSFFAFKAFAFYKQFAIFLIYFQQKCVIRFRN